MKAFIVEYTLKNNFKVQVIVNKQVDRKGVQEKAQAVLALLQGENIKKQVKVHQSIPLINEKTSVEIEEWNIENERYTYAAGKQFAIYPVFSNNVALLPVMGNGYKSAYINFKKEYKDKGSEQIDAAVLVQLEQETKPVINTAPIQRPAQLQRPAEQSQIKSQQIDSSTVVPKHANLDIDEDSIEVYLEDDEFEDEAPEEIEFDLEDEDPVEIEFDLEDEETEVEIVETDSSEDEGTEDISIDLEELLGETENYVGDNEDEVRRQVETSDKIVKDYLDTKEQEKEKKALENAVNNEVKQIDKAIVEKTVKTIMASYDVLYSHLFQETPSGILTSSGIVTVKSDNALQVRSEGNAYASRLYSSIKTKYGNCIREMDYHEEISKNCINSDGTLKYNYVPNFHIRNIYGIYRSDKDGTLKRESNWNKFRSHLIKSLTKYVNLLLESFNGDPLTLSANLVELFTTVFIVEDFDINKSLKMSMKSISVSNSFGGCGDVGKLIVEGKAFPLDASTIEVVNNSEETMGVHNLLVVFDKKLYNGEILFAYKPLKKIIESGGHIGLQHTLLGRDIKGRNVTYNFESPQAVDSLIIAGSGSGKGVVTLNILATFIAEGCPTVYVDWKPDMAAMLWNLERTTGARILAIDGLSGSTDGVTPVRNFVVGINKPKISDITDKLNVVPYIKAFQLMILCAKGRNMNYNGMTSKGKKMQFILDEAQAMNKSLSQLKVDVDNYLNNKDNKPKKDAQPSDEYKYVKKLKAFLDSMYSGSVEFRNTTGRTGNVGLIMLGQQSDCSAWANGALKRDPIGFLVGNCSMKMLGKDATDGNKYSLNGCVPTGNSLLGNMGYFALIPQAVADKSDSDKVKVVKTYLVLNENDYSEEQPGKFTSGMLSNVTDQVLRDSLINDDLYPEDENGKRYVNPLVGFKGLIEYIGSNIQGFNLKENLEAGYREVDKLLSGLGITGVNGAYSCIEEYLFDCSFKGLFTLTELSDLMMSKDTIANLINSEENVGSGFSEDTDLEQSFYVTDNEGIQGEAIKPEHSMNNMSTQRDCSPPSPEVSSPNNHNSFEISGKTGRVIYLRPESNTKVGRLTRENSITVKMPENHNYEKFSDKFFSCLWGTQREFKGRWKFILNSVSDKISANMITRASIFEDTIAFNNKIVATINILGGNEDVRVVDIVNFKMLAKKFKNIKEIQIDREILDAAEVELGEPVVGMFKTFKKLQKFMVVEAGAANFYITRSQLNQEIKMSEAKNIEQRSKARNQFEAVCASKNKRLHEARPGYQSKVWKASKNFGGTAWKVISNNILSNNPHYFKAAGLSILTLGILSFGALFQGFGEIFNLGR